ncbi:hypothetical protein [Plantibacter sp. CFBP 8804]|uniref:hypothetical protein n=1 Tax=Plantibacter sp. CFBP 8804 TaxID=2775270 RepID=UPI00177EFA28|nr:hypothetical protein [Plantibacter sp. CFBP 8804]MBD8515770.1 hypothetical protein [Plantibacter sp. CFBP 8804]
MDDLDAQIQRSAPRAFGEDAEAAECARLVAQEAAFRARPSGVRSRYKRYLSILGLTAGLITVGVSAAAAAPAVFDWVGWAPEATVQRSFDIGEDGAVCQLVARVVPEYRSISTAEADRRTQEARVFLTDYDWDRVVASITTADIDAALAIEQARRAELTTSAEANGTTPPPAATPESVAGNLMATKIFDAFEKAGFLRTGTSIDVAGDCGETAEDAQ